MLWYPAFLACEVGNGGAGNSGVILTKTCSVAHAPIKSDSKTGIVREGVALCRSRRCLKRLAEKVESVDQAMVRLSG